MGYGQRIFRRDSGVYVCRVVVPATLRKRLGRTEIHRSTGLRDRCSALSVAGRLTDVWQTLFSEFLALDRIKAIEAAPLFRGQSHLPLGQAADAVGMSPADLALAVATRGWRLWCHADNWSVQVVNNIDRLEREDAEFTWASVQAEGRPARANGLISLIDSAQLMQSIKLTGAASPWRVMSPSIDTEGVLFVAPGTAKVALEDVWIFQPDVEALRLDYVKSAADQQVATHRLGPSPGPVPSGANNAPTAPAGQVGAASRSHKHGNHLTVTALINRFLDEHKSAQLSSHRAAWKPEEAERNQQKLRCFPELMGEVALEALATPGEGEDLIREYEAKLKRMPTGPGLSKARAETRGASAPALIAWAEAHDEPRMSGQTARSYLSKLSECLKWGIGRGYLVRNPIAAIVGSLPKSAHLEKRTDEQRMAFSQKELGDIFNAEWFRTGRSARTRDGKPNKHFRPFYYWLPLLALHVGGRANEVCQLYLDDISVTPAGTPFIKFQLTRPDQLDLDEGDDGKRAGGKSLKTVNASREVPIHATLIRLGFMEYVEALRTAGYDRLFPELRHDRIKGYGLEGRKWFNERYLGNTLKIHRDGTKTLHSLRHNFATAIPQTGQHGRLKSQLLGHQRGTTLAEQRYTKDVEVDQMASLIAELAIDLPPIEPLDRKEAFDAIDRARRIKLTNRKRAGST